MLGRAGRVTVIALALSLVLTVAPAGDLSATQDASAEICELDGLSVEDVRETVECERNRCDVSLDPPGVFCTLS